MENDVLYNRIMNVIHKEYGDGSTAVANPEGEATDSLEKIQIGDDVYSISGGGGGGAFIVQTLQNEHGKNYLNKTWQEIFNAMKAGMPCYAVTLTEGDAPDDNVCYFNPIMFAEGIESNDWEVGIFDGETIIIFVATGNNNNPVIQEI